LHNVEEQLYPPIHVDETVDEIQVEVAMLFRQGAEEHVRSYANNYLTEMGGTHLDGFLAGLTRTLHRYGTMNELITDDLEVGGEDFTKGLTAVISLQLPEPHFEGAARHRLNNPEAEGIVARIVHDALRIFLIEHHDKAHRIIANAIAAAKARCNARDSLGRPYRATEMDPAWLSWHDAIIPRLAEAIREGRSVDMPILADALEEAGCTAADVLNHCRQAKKHSRDCWALSWMLSETHS
jgi:DNA gyrase/topoisomerase IV subunit B